MRVLLISYLPWTPSNRGMDVITEFFVESGYDVTLLVFPNYRVLEGSKDSHISKSRFYNRNFKQLFASPWVLPYSIKKMWWFPRLLKKILYLSHIESIKRVVDIDTYDLLVIESGKPVLLHEILPKQSFVVYRQSDPVWMLAAKDKELVECEEKVCERANLILALRKEYVSSRYHHKTAAWVNGFNVPNSYNNSNPYSSGKSKGVYIGLFPIDISILDRIASDHRDTDFHIIGSCVGNKERSRFLKRHSNVIFHGFLKPYEYIRYIKYADFGIVPYIRTPRTRYFGLTSKYLLFMSFGLPIVSVSTDFIRDGYMNILVADTPEEFSRKVDIAKTIGKVKYEIDFDYYSAEGRKEELRRILDKYIDL